MNQSQFDVATEDSCMSLLTPGGRFSVLHIQPIDPLFSTLQLKSIFKLCP